MKTWRQFGALTITLLVMLVPVGASAATLTETQVEKMLTLLKTFTEDQAFITKVAEALREEAPVTPIVTCENFSENLKIGDTSPDVALLQQVLNLEGATLPVTGTFTIQTAFAVKAFQEKYASEVLAPHALTRGTGFVGPTTRAKLLKLHDCGEKNQAVSPDLPVATASTTASVATTTPERTYGALDYNDDGRVDSADTRLLLENAVSANDCDEGKVCDLNKDGKVAASDALMLANYIGTKGRPGQLDYNDDLKLDAEDTTILKEAFATQCAEGRVCDLSGDAKFSEEDIALFEKYVGA